MLEILFKVIEMECISIFFKHPQDFSNTLTGFKKESKFLPSSGVEIECYTQLFEA